MDFAVSETDELVERASTEYLGRWSRLVSTTNWEKGRIVSQWRAALVAAGAAPAACSDEAWSRRVGQVSSQHVGRLRRVWERFDAVREQYPGLYWSHFYAVLDWEDAEMWLEGAVHSRWSVAQMRRQRWEALGAVAADEPRDEDVVEAERDEDFSPTDGGHDERELPDFAARERDDAADGEVVAEPFDSDGQAAAGDDTAAAPFASLPPLPDDLAEAVEALKLAIVRHRLAGWSEVPRDAVLAALDALRSLVLQPTPS